MYTDSLKLDAIKSKSLALYIAGIKDGSINKGNFHEMAEACADEVIASMPDVQIITNDANSYTEILVLTVNNLLGYAAEHMQEIEVE
jgi:hypothetical protein